MGRALYIGKRTADGCVVKFVDEDDLKENPQSLEDLSVGEDLPLRLDLQSHSPDGFEWGYRGSGPSQLALALLAHATGDDALAQRVYSQFRDIGLAVITSEMWMLTKVEIEKWVRSHVDAEKWVAYGKANRKPQETSTIVSYSGNA